jgi:hypothetical protein
VPPTNRIALTATEFLNMVPIREHFPVRVASLRFCWHLRLAPDDFEGAEPGSSVLKLNGQIRSTHNQDGAIVLDIRGGQMFSLNLVGSRILELLKDGCTETQIVDEIIRESGADRKIVEADLQEFLVQLEKHRLLEVHPLNGQA